MPPLNGSVMLFFLPILHLILLLTGADDGGGFLRRPFLAEFVSVDSVITEANCGLGTADSRPKMQVKMEERFAGRPIHNYG